MRTNLASNQSVQAFKWSWKSSDGLQMYSRGWSSRSNSKAVLILIHGHGEHIGRYEHVGNILAENGYILLGFDLRGHGRSAGPRGHTPSYNILLDDITAFLKQVEERYPKLPRFLYGHSMGGNLVLNYTLRLKPNLQGVIVTAPWLFLTFEPPAVKVILTRVMDIFAPKFTRPSGLETAALSHDESVIRAYENDLLVHDKISARLFVGIYKAGLWVLEHSSEFYLPLLLMHGSADRLTSVEASKQFASTAGKNVTLRIWDDWYHEIHNEPQKAEIFRIMIDWIEEHSNNRNCQLKY